MFVERDSQIIFVNGDILENVKKLEITENFTDGDRLNVSVIKQFDPKGKSLSDIFVPDPKSRRLHLDLQYYLSGELASVHVITGLRKKTLKVINKDGKVFEKLDLIASGFELKQMDE